MKKIVVLTGAGMSAESGITTFRDSNGLWEQFRVEDVASIEGYERNPQLVLQFYNDRRRQLADVEPCAGHRLLAEMERDYQMVIVTQNVDNLHERAGSTNVIHLHGELTKATSSRNPNDARCIVDIPVDHEIRWGDQAKDGSQLRPFIVWFGEPVPMIEKAIEEVQTADIFVIIGTSLNVYPAAGLIHYVSPSVPVYLIDPKSVETHGARGIQFIQKGASEGVAELKGLLKNLKYTL